MITITIGPSPALSAQKVIPLVLRLCSRSQLDSINSTVQHSTAQHMHLSDGQLRLLVHDSSRQRHHTPKSRPPSPDRPEPRGNDDTHARIVLLYSPSHEHISTYDDLTRSRARGRRPVAVDVQSQSDSLSYRATRAVGLCWSRGPAPIRGCLCRQVRRRMGPR